MRDSVNTNWAVVLKDYYPEVYALQDGEDVRRWEHEIGQHLASAVTGAEIIAAIQWGAVRDTKVRVPTPLAVSSWVRGRRRELREHVATTGIRALLDRERGRLAAASPLERWDIAVSRNNVEEIEVLLALAETMPGGYERPDTTELQRACLTIGTDGVGDGYTLVLPGEQMRRGDEYWSHETRTWVPVSDEANGNPLRLQKLQVRRKTEATP